jgi:hypothetical protein
MAPQLVSSDFSGLNLIDIDCSSAQKRPNLPGFHAQARPGMSTPVWFWEPIVEPEPPEPENPSKTPNAPGFHARAEPGMATPVLSWAEKLNLVIIHQFLTRKATKNIITLHVSSIQLSIARFLGDPAYFNRPCVHD